MLLGLAIFQNPRCTTWIGLGLAWFTPWQAARRDCDGGLAEQECDVDDARLDDAEEAEDTNTALIALIAAKESNKQAFLSITGGNIMQFRVCPCRNHGTGRFRVSGLRFRRRVPFCTTAAAWVSARTMAWTQAPMTLNLLHPGASCAFRTRTRTRMTT